ncbi:hypothetical protein EUGRSUZ_A01079 [Eucalyptus grandis]|uniref:Uncharacterized protein n=2 Tax=Eucalyptus grandis TaxID=71139 RepID=A0ACC3M501_EUCGR|nr:hypothetical protein EUGRSUZ_A01079 [Eucalyptus grandis]
MGGGNKNHAEMGIRLEVHCIKDGLLLWEKRSCSSRATRQSKPRSTRVRPGQESWERDHRSDEPPKAESVVLVLSSWLVASGEGVHVRGFSPSFRETRRCTRPFGLALRVERTRNQCSISAKESRRNKG